MSKAGLHVMTQSLAVEWGDKNIRLNAIAPGPFPTEGAWARLNPGDQRNTSSGGANPMGRVGKMPELCNLAVLLLGPGAEYVNGQTIAIDGAAHQAGGGGFAGLRGWSDQQWEAARTSIRGANEKDRAQRTV
jgi:NAD(P)-dependent dehydrogenase (short-subunit alcohol dehydrogenase family)